MVNRKELMFQELRILFTYCWLPLPVATFWSYSVGLGFGFDDDRNRRTMLNFIALAIELIAITVMVYREDYARLDPMNFHKETKMSIFVRFAVSLWVCVGSLLLFDQVMSMMDPTLTAGGAVNVIKILERKVTSVWYWISLTQIGILTCLSGIRLGIHLCVDLIRLHKCFRMPIYIAVTYYYMRYIILPIFLSSYM